MTFPHFTLPFPRFRKYALPRALSFVCLFVCLSVCLLALQRSHFLVNRLQIISTDRKSSTDETIKFWIRSGEGQGHKKLSKIAKFPISQHCGISKIHISIKSSSIHLRFCWRMQGQDVHQLTNCHPDPIQIADSAIFCKLTLESPFTTLENFYTS